MSNQQLHLPSTIRCLCEITLTKLWLRIAGFQRTLRFASGKVVEWTPDVDPMALAEALSRRIALAAAMYPARARCLEQGLTLYRLLRRRGVDAQFRVGVQPYRFRAHAWVEYRGIPINEPGDGVNGLAVFPEVPT